MNDKMKQCFFYKLAICIWLLSASCDGINNSDKLHDPNLSTLKYTENDILSNLDSCGVQNPYKFFPDLGDGYLALSGSRITLFADTQRWAIAFEKTGYNARDYSVDLQIYYFGNCLYNLDIASSKYPVNKKYFYRIDPYEVNRITGGRDYLTKSADSVLIGSEKMLISYDYEDYAKAGINLKNGQITMVSLLRQLEFQRPNLFRAKSEELYSCIPDNLPILMTIDSWHQESYNNFLGASTGVTPSSQEVFQLISKILVSKDTSLYKPTQSPNNNWKFWTREL